jgi:hypothetical protein
MQANRLRPRTTVDRSRVGRPERRRTDGALSDRTPSDSPSVATALRPTIGNPGFRLRGQVYAEPARTPLAKWIDWKSPSNGRMRIRCGHMANRGVCSPCDSIACIRLFFVVERNLANDRDAFRSGRFLLSDGRRNVRRKSGLRADDVSAGAGDFPGVASVNDPAANQSAAPSQVQASAEPAGPDPCPIAQFRKRHGSDRAVQFVKDRRARPIVQRCRRCVVRSRRRSRVEQVGHAVQISGAPNDETRRFPDALRPP